MVQYHNSEIAEIAEEPPRDHMRHKWLGRRAAGYDKSSAAPADMTLIFLIHMRAATPVLTNQQP
jgi:hypothetical protein